MGAGADAAVSVGATVGASVGVGDAVGVGGAGCRVGVGSGGVNVCTIVGTIAGNGVERRGVGVGEGESVATTSGADELAAVRDASSCARRQVESAAPMTKPIRTTATKMGNNGMP